MSPGFFVFDIFILITNEYAHRCFSGPHLPNQASLFQEIRGIASKQDARFKTTDMEAPTDSFWSIEEPEAAKRGTSDPKQAGGDWRATGADEREVHGSVGGVTFTWSWINGPVVAPLGICGICAAAALCCWLQERRRKRYDLVRFIGSRQNSSFGTISPVFTALPKSKSMKSF